MCGKGSSQPYMPTPFGGAMPVTSTQSVNIPPEILARYNAVNAQAQATAGQAFNPYAQYPSAFISPLTQSQQAAIYNINRAQGMTEPYYQQAAQMAGASTAGAYNPAVAGISDPYYREAAARTQAGMQGAANYGIAGLATPSYQQAQALTGEGARNVANQGVAQLAMPYYQQAQNLTQAGAQDIANQGVAMASQPAYDVAGQMTRRAAQGVSDIGALGISDPYYQSSQRYIQQGGRGVANLGVAGLSAPAYQQAQQMTGMAGQVQVPEMSAADIQKYMSPYMQQVIDPTMRALRQQQEQAMAGQTGSAIRAGAFGGDRAAIAAANLAGQQQLASGQTMGNLLQQGYGQALSAAQQQQQIRQAEMSRILQAGRQQADIGTMGRQAYEQQQAIAQQDAARQLQAAQQSQGLGTAARQAYEQQQALAQQDQARLLQAAQQQAGLGTLSREALQQQQTMAQQDAARKLQAAQQSVATGTAARGAYEQQQALAQQDAARQLQAAQQAVATGTAMRGAYEQQQAIQQADLQRQIAGAQQLAGIGTQQRQAAEQQQAIRQADLARTQQAAQLMGGLGTSAQQAALAAAQAQLGAGAAEQQTSQAGLQALYNQYLQQQAYPFQIAQFLANIAMGTGALSGSTTTTAQAQPFFSDRRLKEGVGAAKYGSGDNDEPEIIGETFDGQKIYRYRLLNPVTGELEPPQIGLMADEAERREPEAVMRDRGTGYKMLDYKAATDDAAKIGHGLGAARMGGAVDAPGDYARGGYARGGVGYAYSSPDSPESEMDRILALQEGMYGGGGGGIGGSPYTGGGGGISMQGYVPKAEIGSYELLRPASPPTAQTAMTSEFAEGIGKAEGLATNLDKMYDLYEKHTKKDNSSPSTPTRLPGAVNSRGGVAGYAAGGVMPYQNKGEDYFPEEVLEKKEITPLKAAEPPKSVTPYKDESMLDKASGFIDKAEKAASLGSTLFGLGKAGLTAMAAFSDRRLKEGVGRTGYATLGAVKEEGGEEDSNAVFDRMLGIESGNRQLDREGRPITSPKGAIGIAQVMPGTAPEAAKLAGLPFDEERYRTDKDYNKALGRAYFDEQRRRFGSDELAAAAYNAGPGALSKALGRAEREGGDYLSYLPRETQKYVAGVGASPALGAIERSMPANARSFYATTAPTPDKGIGAAALQPTTIPGAEAASEKGNGIVDFLTSKEFIIPALTGLGAMASSPSRYLGSALLQGAGAGAQSYMDVLGKESELAKRAAETGEVKARTGTQEQETEKRKAETLRQYQELYKDAFFDRGGIQMVRLANGNAMSLYEWKKNPRPVWGQGADMGEPAAPTAAGAAKPISVSDTPANAPFGIGYDDKSKSSALSELGMLNTPGKAALEARSAEYRNMVDKDAEIARDQKLYNNEVAGVIAEMASKTGMQTPGAAGSLRAMIVNYGNTISRAAGLGDQFGSSDTADAILSKINTLAGEQRVSSAGQQALGSLQSVIKAYPNLDQPPFASTFNAASNMVNNQMKLDRQQHADTYGQESGQLYSRAGVDFKRSNTPAKYKREQDVLQTTMMRDPKAFAAMVSGRVSAEDIEQYFRDKAHGGITGVSRYFGD